MTVQELQRHSKASALPAGDRSRTSSADRRAAGKARRDKVPSLDHAPWRPAPHRHDPIKILHAADAARLPDLVPLRYGRMPVSPFTFYRAGIIDVQLER